MNHGVGKTKSTKKAAKKAGLKTKKVKLKNLKKKDLLGLPVSDLSQASDVHTPTAEEKLWFCFRGPYDCSAWAGLWTREKLLDFLKDHPVALKVLAKHPKFKTVRIEHHMGSEDEDGRIYVWGEDESGSGPGLDTQHKGYVVTVDGEVVYNDCIFNDEEDEDHDREDCDLCRRVE